MDDQDIVDLIDDLATGVPETAPPLERLLAGGQARVRRRSRLVVGAVAAAVVLVAGTGLVARSITTGKHPQTVAPTARPGMRLVGVGRVVVAVPDSWIDFQGTCAYPATPFVQFEPEAAVGCIPTVPRPPQMNLSLSRVSDWRGGAPPVGTECSKSPRGWCEQRWQVPGQDVELSVEYRKGDVDMTHTLTAIKDSVTVLPAGYTTVPEVVSLYRAGNPDVATVLRSAGLTLKGVTPRRFEGSDPAPGTIVRTGSGVRLLTTAPELKQVYPVPHGCEGTTITLHRSDGTAVPIYPTRIYPPVLAVRPDEDLSLERSGPCATAPSIKSSPSGQRVTIPADSSPFLLPRGTTGLSIDMPMCAPSPPATRSDCRGGLATFEIPVEVTNRS